MGLAFVANKSAAVGGAGDEDEEEEVLKAVLMGTCRQDRLHRGKLKQNIERKNCLFDAAFKMDTNTLMK